MFDGKTYEVPDEAEQEELKEHIDRYWRQRKSMKEAEWKKINKIYDRDYVLTNDED